MKYRPISGPEAICDFCDLQPVVKIYDAAPVSTIFAGHPIAILETRWTACATCAELIDQNRWQELTDRAAKCWLEMLRQKGQEYSYQLQFNLRQDLERLYARFREAMGRTA